MSDRHPMTRKTCEGCGESFVGGPKARWCMPLCGVRTRARRQGVPSRGWGATEEAKKLLRPYQDRGLTYQAAVRAWLADYKMSKGCADCGYREHFSALQLDHEGEKRVEISLARSSLHRLLEEIRNGKCVVRCASCHSIRTWERKQK